MTFFSSAARVFTLFLILGIVACSAEKETGLYGYEDEYAPPEPDIIPVLPDDNPGRTVDEMLGLKARSVTVKKAEYAEPSKSAEQSEYQGRFGSKEKVSLRKGLNAPEAALVYGKGKRKPAEEVRILEVKKQKKDHSQSLSEEEVLARIIAPKKEPVRIIEVVPAKKEKLPASARGDGIAPGRLTDMDYIPFDVAENKAGKEIILPKAENLSSAMVVRQEEQPAEQISAQVTEEKLPVQKNENQKLAEKEAPSVKSEPENVPLRIVTENKTIPSEGNILKPFVPKAVEKLRLPPIEEEEEIVLLKPPSFAEPEEAEEEEIILLKPPFVEEEKIVLIPPGEERIVLKRPEERKFFPSVEIFLDE